MKTGSYERWIAEFDTITADQRRLLRAEQDQLPRKPLISILLPVFNPHIAWLAAAIESVRQQTYTSWQLCIADDASTDAGVRSFLDEQARADQRITVTYRETNGHISACSNSALALAAGEWCALLDQDDLLREHALSLVAREINASPDAAVIYSDEDFIDLDGRRSNPFFKPDWNPELFLGQNYINHLGVYRTDLLREIGGFRSAFDGSQDYDLLLRCIERTGPRQIRHIPHILYHWRMVPGSLAEVRDAKPYAKNAARRALADHVTRRGWRAQVEPCPENIESHRVRFEVPLPRPSVTILMHGSGEVADAAALPILSRQDVEIRGVRNRGNLAGAINGAAATAGSDILILLHESVEFDDREWLDELLAQVMRAEVGAVGARIWNSDGTLRNGGYLLGVAGVASPAHEGLPRGHPGYFNRTFLQRNVSAVSAECMAVRGSVFRGLGGFDATHLRDHFHDIDFCLRAREQNLAIVWTPYANPIAHSASLPPSPDDVQWMNNRWGNALACDPFYSVNLSLEEQFELAFPPRRALPAAGKGGRATDRHG